MTDYIKINLSALPKDKKRQAWAWIQTYMPGFDELLKSDLRDNKMDVVIEIKKTSLPDWAKL